MHPTRIDLPEELREQVVVILNDRLADVLDLGLQAKQAHWNVKGPQFIALHELFDELSDILRDQSDEVAERITALGGTAEGTVAAVAGRTRLPTYPPEITAGRDHLQCLATALATYGKAVRFDIEQATRLGDADTADLFTGISREIDKQLWFLEAHLQSDR
ncbi:MAG: DNA starvation/stationary phase protection protein Dps [Planctomycetales bacterium 12-60-4]|nr:MAG: DNA starvation/stationary phase protection protein Dps [Planctomycetales bacterium 12-60-4]